MRQWQEVITLSIQVGVMVVASERLVARKEKVSHLIYNIIIIIIKFIINNIIIIIKKKKKNIY